MLRCQLKIHCTCRCNVCAMGFLQRKCSSSMIEIRSAALLFTLKPLVLARSARFSFIPPFAFFFIIFFSLLGEWMCMCVYFCIFFYHFWHFNCCPVQRARSNATISTHLLYTYSHRFCIYPSIRWYSIRSCGATCTQRNTSRSISSSIVHYAPTEQNQS